MLCYIFLLHVYRSFKLKLLFQVVKVLFSVIRFFKNSESKEHCSLVWEDVSLFPQATRETSSCGLEPLPLSFWDRRDLATMNCSET